MHRSSTQPDVDRMNLGANPAANLKYGGRRRRRHTVEPIAKSSPSPDGRCGEGAGADGNPNAAREDAEPLSASFMAFTASLPGHGPHPASPKPHISDSLRGAHGHTLHQPFHTVTLPYNGPHDNVRLERLRFTHNCGGQTKNLAKITSNGLTISGRSYFGLKEPLPDIGIIFSNDDAKSGKKFIAGGDSKGQSKRISFHDIKIIFVLGPPGFESNQVCTRLASELGMLHISFETTVNFEIKSKPKSLASTSILDALKNNQPLPKEIVTRILFQGISNSLDTLESNSCKGIIIEGFPRALDQALVFENSEFASKPPDAVIMFDIVKESAFPSLQSNSISHSAFKLETPLEYSRLIDDLTTHYNSVYNNNSKSNLYRVSLEAALKADTLLAIVRAQIVQSLPQVAPQTANTATTLDLRGKSLVFVLGGPGSGKGTQCAYIRELYKMCHLSVGDLLRNEISMKTAIGGRAASLVAEGKIVPLEITAGLLRNAIQTALERCPQETPKKDTVALHNVSGSNSDESLEKIEGILVDGFPREIEQCVNWEKEMCLPTTVLFFDCPLQTLEKRLLKRGETSGRSDDNIESIKKRFVTFREISYPVVEYYKAVKKIGMLSSENSVEDVFKETCKYLDRVLPIKKLSFPNVIYVLGGPGSGKGTQCDKLVRNLKYAHLSTGDLLRAEVNDKSEIGLRAESIMKEGGMVPIDIIRSLLLKNMRLALEKGAPGFLIDGYPRTLEQAQDIVIIAPPKAALYFECSQEELVQRLLKRGETSGRADDNLESIRVRIETFLSKSVPVINFFENRGVLRKIDSQKPISEITDKTLEALQ